MQESLAEQSPENNPQEFGREKQANRARQLHVNPCEPSDHLKESPKSPKKSRKEPFWGVLESPKKYPKKQKKTKGQIWVFFDSLGYFRGLCCRPPKKKLFLTLLDFRPGGTRDSCKWSQVVISLLRCWLATAVPTLVLVQVYLPSEGQKYTAKVFAALRNQAPQQARKRCKFSSLIFVKEFQHFLVYNWRRIG